MIDSNKTYTYKGGQKVDLKKSPDQMMVRVLPNNLDDEAIIKTSVLFHNRWQFFQVRQDVSANKPFALGVVRMLRINRRAPLMKGL